MQLGWNRRRVILATPVFAQVSPDARPALVRRSEHHRHERKAFTRFNPPRTSRKLIPGASLAFLQLPTTNYLFVDTSAAVSVIAGFYRAVLQSTPTKHGFHPSEQLSSWAALLMTLSASTDEGPQTTVIISRGFWIGKYGSHSGRIFLHYEHEPQLFPRGT